MMLDRDDRPEDNLRRILLDGARLRAGERRVAELLAEGALTGTIGAIMVDLDSSGEIRSRGIGAKMELVRFARERLNQVVPQECVVVDSGTRDETYVVLGNTTAAGVATVAEAIRAAIAGEPFSLVAIPEPFRVTASIGYTVTGRLRSAAQLFLASREALYTAKRERDCVRTTTAVPEPLTITLPVALIDAVTAAGQEWTEAVRIGLQAVEEKYGGIWHWAIDQRPAVASAPDVDTSGVSAAEAAFFQRLLGSAVFEAALASDRTSPGVRRSASRPRSGLSAPYLPGEWLAVDATVRDERHPIERVLAARWSVLAPGATATVTTQWLPSQRAQLRRICDRRAITEPLLFADAAQLAADRAAFT